MTVVASEEDLMRAQRILSFEKAKWSQSVSIPRDVRFPDKHHLEAETFRPHAGPVTEPEPACSRHPPGARVPRCGPAS